MKKMIATVFTAVVALAALSETAVDRVKNMTWCSLGTSITDFNDVPTTGRTKGYQYFLMDELGWDRAKLTDAGHSGTLVSSASSKPPDTSCDIYTVEYGVNDWGKGHPVGTLDDYKNYLYNNRAVRWNNFASCYRNLIEMIRKVNSHAIIILITPRKAYGTNTDAGTNMFPARCDDPTLAGSVDDYYDPSQGSNVHGDQTYLKDYADLIKAIGEYEGFPVVDWYSDAATQDNLASLSVDVAVHPNDAGYEIMADLLAPKILEAVAAAGGDGPPASGSSVTLNANGGTVSSTTVELPAESLPTPTRDGYHFVGWFEDKTLTSYDYDATKVTADNEYVPGTFLYGTPVTAPSADYAGKTLYAKWVKTSVYEHFHGKKVAVYGDSVSTLLGHVPSAETEMFNGGVFYGQDYVDKGINEHTHWWGQLVDALGMELLQINAIGGSSVGAYAYEYGLERKAMMNYTRLRILDDAGAPDVILVAAGINDYNDNTTGFDANAPYLTGDLDRVTSICPSFAKAYALMIRRLKDLYPSAEIVALSSFDVGAAAATETGNDCIRKTCALYNVVNIDMRNAFTLNDGSGVNYRAHGIHPGISGLSAIANHFLESYAPITNPVDVPACGHTWGFGVLTTPATATAPGVRTYTCRHCDATKTEEVAYVAVSEGTEADITSQATVKGVYLLPDDRQVAANTVTKTSGGDFYNGYLDLPTNLVDGNADTVYRDWILNDRYIAFSFDQPMVVTSVRLVGVRNAYPDRIQVVDPSNRLLGKTDVGIPWDSVAQEHRCTIATTERVPNTELRLAFDFDCSGKDFQLTEVEIYGYAAGEEPPVEPPDNPPEDPVETADVIALRNVAVATAIGTEPTLPEKVYGLKADGTLAGEYDVTWDTIPTPGSAGVTTVPGTATVEGRQMSVTASVRAATASLVNLTETASAGIVKASKTNANPEKWLMSVEPLADNQWSDYIGNVQYSNDPNTTELTLGWSSPVTVSEVVVYFNGQGGNYQPPANVKFYDDSGDSSTEIAFTAGAVVDSGTVYAHIVYTLETPKSLSKIRFYATPATDSNARILFTRRMWVYGLAGGGSVTPQATDALTALEVDGETVPEFASDTFSYTVDNGTAITKAENNTDNVAVTILPKNENNNAYAVTLAENGSTKTYTVAMPIVTCPHDVTHLENQVDATCTKPGYTGDTVCDACGRTMQKGSATESLGHDWSDWEVTKEPTRDEPGSKRRECLREECDAEETQEIPKIVDVVALRNVAVATAVTTAPTLPAKVAGLKADGTLGDEYEVKWNPVEAPTEEGVTTVTGAATVNGKVMTVTASIRAAEADPVNHSSSATPGEISCTSGQVYSKSKDALKSDEFPTAGQWDDYIVYANNGSANKLTVELIWDNPITFSKVTVCFHQDTNNYQYPENECFYNISGDTPVKITGFTRGAIQNEKTTTAYIEYTFDSPQTLSKFKFEATPEHTSNSRMFFLRRLWVQGAGSVDPFSTDTLTALEVDGESVSGFEPETTSYEVWDGQAITKAENGTDNVAVTILPKCEDKAYAVTLAEDGESTKAYTVSMPKSHDHTFGEWQVMTPATVYASGLRRRVCTYDGCKVYEEEVIPQIERKSVTWINVDFANYTDGSTIADGQVDQVNGGTWSKPSADDTATVVRGDVNAAALAVTNNYLCYAAKRQTSAGRDATVRFKAKFQKPNTDALPEALDLGQTAVFVFPKGKTGCYKAYTADGWVELVGATPDFDKFVTITIEFRYNDGGRSAMVKIDDVVCTPTDAETPWFALAGSATQLTSVGFFGELGLGNFWGECLTPKTGLIFLFQ